MPYEVVFHHKLPVAQEVNDDGLPGVGHTHQHVSYRQTVTTTEIQKLGLASVEQVEQNNKVSNVMGSIYFSQSSFPPFIRSVNANIVHVYKYIKVIDEAVPAEHPLSPVKMWNVGF